MTRWHWSLLFVSLALILAVLVERNRRVVDDTLPAALADEPELYLRGADVTQYTPQGLLDYRLLAAEIFHYPDRDLTRLVDPDLTIFGAAAAASGAPTDAGPAGPPADAAAMGAAGPGLPPAPPWQVRSRHGEVHHFDDAGQRRERIELNEAVEVTHLRPDGEVTTVTTEALTILPHARYAETDRPVIIAGRHGNTSAAGLRGDLERGVLELQSSPERRVVTVVYPRPS